MAENLTKNVGKFVAYLLLILLSCRPELGERSAFSDEMLRPKGVKVRE